MRIAGSRPLQWHGLFLMLCVTLVSIPGFEARAGGTIASTRLGQTDTGDYRDTRLDPDASTAPSANETTRIDSTTREVWTGSDGGRWLTLVVAPFDRNVYSQTKVHLDTDGDRAAEFVMVIWSRDLAGEGCWLRELKGGRRTDGRLRRLEPGDYPEWEGPVACRVPLGLLRPTARIAWWAGAAVEGGMEVHTYDRAPNAGWYL